MGESGTGDEDDEEDLEWPIRWDEATVGNWAEYLEAREAKRERHNVIWNGHRVELETKEVLEDIKDGGIISAKNLGTVDEEGTHLGDVYAMESDALANWEATVPVKQLRGWIADWKREAREDGQGDKDNIFRVDAKYKPKGVKVVPVDTQFVRLI